MGRTGWPWAPLRRGAAAGRRRCENGPVTAELASPAVRAWLDSVLAGQPIATARRLAGGYRNDNVLLVTAAGQRYVLRRYPADAGAGSASRTCAIEAAVAARLQGIVPVAEVVAADPAGSAAGTPLLLSRYAPGTMVSELLAGAGGDDARKLGHAAGALLPDVGSVSFGTAGFFTGPDLIPSAGGMPGSLLEFVESCLRAANARAGSGDAAGLTRAEQDGLRELAVRAAPLVARAESGRRLVHADYNPKNLLAVRRGGRWAISAVLDWEFAFSGSPLADIGNMLRPRPAVPADFTAGFIAGYREAAGRLPPDWREISEALDLYALADFLTRPPDHRYSGQAVALIRARLSRE